MNLYRGLIRLYCFLTPIGWVTLGILMEFIFDIFEWNLFLILGVFSMIVGAFFIFGIAWVVQGFKKDPDK